MGVITALKPQRNQKRINVYVDGKFGFGIDLQNLLEGGLKIGLELSEKQTEEIIKKAEFQKTYDKLLRFATLRPRSEKEVKDWFKRRKIHTSLHESLTEKLKKLKLLDDGNFAKWWVEQRTSFSPRGKRALRQELIIKGVGRETIDEVLRKSFRGPDEISLARDLLEKKKYRWKG